MPEKNLMPAIWFFLFEIRNRCPHKQQNRDNIGQQPEHSEKEVTDHAAYHAAKAEVAHEQNDCDRECDP